MKKDYHHLYILFYFIQLFHPNIIHCYGCLKDDDFYYIVQEYARGGDLCERVNLTNGLTVQEIRIVIKTLLFTLHYCHYNNVIHRDVKPENILLSKPNDLTSIKLSDFGLASISLGLDTSGICGTPEYIAPEILQNTRYNKKVDIWSVGCLAYYLVANETPFADKKKKGMAKLLSNICKGVYKFDHKNFNDCPSSLKDFIRFLLVLEPSKRPNAEKALRHSFLNEEETIDDEEEGEEHKDEEHKEHSNKVEKKPPNYPTDIIEQNWYNIRKYQTIHRWRIVYFILYIQLKYSILFYIRLLKKPKPL